MLFKLTIHSQYNQVIKSAFELEYPKLLRVLNNFWQKVAQNNEGYQLMFYGTVKEGFLKLGLLKQYFTHFSYCRKSG